MSLLTQFILKKIGHLCIVLATLLGLWDVVGSESRAQEPSSLPLTLPAQKVDAPDAFEKSIQNLLSSSAAVSMRSSVTSIVTATETTDLNDEVVLFSELGFTEQTLRGPHQAEALRFYLPADWELTGEAELELDFVALFGGIGSQANMDISSVAGGSLEVSLNDVLLSKILLDEIGERTVTAPIPESALVSSREDGRHELEFFLDSGLNCQYDFQTTVAVQPTSHLILPHRSVTPPIDLRLLPRPIYQGTLIPDTAVIIIPDNPTSDELQAALAIAAGFGRMSSGKLALSLIPINQLDPEVQQTNHLIFVGKPNAFPLLNEVTLPATIRDSGFEVAEAKAGDGIIQMAVSPWNSAKVALVVSGDSDEAITKAGQAVSSGVVRTGTQPDLALVSEVQPDLEIGSDQFEIDRTFASLGYATQTSEGRDTHWFEYRFDVPPGYVADPEAYLELIFNHSALLDHEQSGMIIHLNNELIGSVGFSEETTSLSSAQFKIPRFALHSGVNQLSIQAELIPATTCSDANLGGLWLTLWSESSLHLPLVPLQGEVNRLFDLGEYPAPFALDTTLSSTAFVLPAGDPTAWDVAARLAFDLGYRAKTPLAEFEVVTSETLPEDIGQTRHLLIIGQPNQLPLIAELEEALPAPFEAGSNLATERAMRVVYRLPTNASIGYLEALLAPWNKSRTIVTVLGSDPQALRWAGAALTDPRKRSELKGNFLAINDKQIITGDRELGTDTELAAVMAGLEKGVEPASAGEAAAVTEETEASAAETTTAAETANLSANDRSISSIKRPAWLIPLLFLSTVFMIVIVGIVAISSWWQRRPVS